MPLVLSDNAGVQQSSCVGGGRTGAASPDKIGEGVGAAFVPLGVTDPRVVVGA